MKERPILFSAPMIRALLAGTKTQTRRIVSPQPKPFDATMDFWEWPSKRAGAEPKLRLHVPQFQKSLATLCPYGRAGDRLFVRERVAMNMPQPDFPNSVAYYATDAARCSPLIRWRPSIHMPRWASRITLEITEVRVEWLQEISEADAKAEGAEQDGVETGRVDANSNPEMIGSYVYGYSQVWEAINGAGSWDANPFVWALTFKRVGQANG